MTRKHIFVGGWINTGTRLICNLLNKKGYTIIDNGNNEVHDYMAYTNFRRMFGDFYIRNHTSDAITDCIKRDTENINQWVLKHGMLMKMIPELKKQYPDSIFILCIRNPMDVFAKNHYMDPTYKEFFGISLPSLQEKYESFKSWYDVAIEHADYVVRLEDLLYDKEKTISDIYSFLECNDELSPEILEIIGDPSASVGVGEKILTNCNHIITNEMYEYFKTLGY